ncbi:hypothetical protein F2Q68_00038031 [Brassica cretica]|uniref:DC1 domain-containing protein n=1 Tax=Brassica cretica TaxID=69181 RepID=A0A8S9HCA3_BRACR|nr:hypothetical protein F2Q68_00038031 [Brassica cretica]
MDGEERPNFTERCRLSDPLFPHSLRRRDNPPPSECFRCGPVRYEFEEGDWHYYCDICKVVFHNDSCHVFPQGMRHPHHPNHTLNTAIQYSETEIFSFNKNLFEISMLMAVVAPIHDKSFEIESDKTCDWCKDKLGRMFHHCHKWRVRSRGQSKDPGRSFNCGRRILKVDIPKGAEGLGGKCPNGAARVSLEVGNQGFNVVLGLRRGLL